jgi:hypothetical protein
MPKADKAGKQAVQRVKAAAGRAGSKAKALATNVAEKKAVKQAKKAVAQARTKTKALAAQVSGKSPGGSPSKGERRR